MNRTKSFLLNLGIGLFLAGLLVVSAMGIGAWFVAVAVEMGKP